MIRIIANIFGALLQVYCIYIFFDAFNKPKVIINKWVNRAIITAVCAFHIVTSIYLMGTPLLLCFLATAFILSQLFSSKQYIKFVLTIVIAVICVASEFIVSASIMAFSNSDFENVTGDDTLYSLGLLLSAFIQLAIVVIVRLFKHDFSVDSIKKSHLAVLSVLPISTIFVIDMMYQVLGVIENRTLKVLFVISSMLLITSNIVTVEVIRRQNRLYKSELELAFVKSSLAEQKKHYADISASQEQIKRINHDLKNFYISSIAQIESGNAESVADKMKQELDVINADKALIDTGHPAIDTIFENKIAAANSHGITCDIKFKYQAEILIDEMDISIVVGNIMDNAIEACQAFDGEKVIEGYIHSNESDVVIKIANSSAISDGLKTKKSDKRFHGYGTKNIESIAEKYSGSTKFTSENNRFNTLVILTNN